MSDATRNFNARLRRIDESHTRLGRGYVGKVRSDGLIVFAPRRRRRMIPLRGVLYLLVGFVLFKAVVLAHLGGDAYEARIARLAEGHVLEQTGAKIMHPDALTLWMAGYLAPVLR
ncbi:MAG: hypothetical protein ACU0AX_13815 [Roseovarius sp.]|uniref:hypothetical protein n=1 Tax=Roseovarius sp. TaxID=1486281 RepID=UPI0040580C2A